jgi:hypothetical protein
MLRGLAERKIVVSRPPRLRLARKQARSERKRVWGLISHTTKQIAKYAFFSFSFLFKFGSLQMSGSFFLSLKTSKTSQA